MIIKLVCKQRIKAIKKDSYNSLAQLKALISDTFTELNGKNIDIYYNDQDGDHIMIINQSDLALFQDIKAKSVKLYIKETEKTEFSKTIQINLNQSALSKGETAKLDNQSIESFIKQFEKKEEESVVTQSQLKQMKKYQSDLKEQEKIPVKKEEDLDQIISDYLQKEEQETLRKQKIAQEQDQKERFFQKLKAEKNELALLEEKKELQSQRIQADHEAKETAQLIIQRQLKEKLRKEEQSLKNIQEKQIQQASKLKDLEELKKKNQLQQNEKIALKLQEQQERKEIQRLDKIRLEKIQQANEKIIVHEVSCYGCKSQVIIGIRYSCILCDNFYNLCEQCEQKYGHPHALLKIKSPEKDITQTQLKNRFKWGKKIFPDAPHPPMFFPNDLDRREKQLNQKIDDFKKQKEHMRNKVLEMEKKFDEFYRKGKDEIFGNFEKSVFDEQFEKIAENTRALMAQFYIDEGQAYQFSKKYPHLSVTQIVNQYSNYYKNSKRMFKPW